MNAVAFASAKGAPGVTTTALLLAAVWPSSACLVEADPRGGDLRYWQPDQNGQPLRSDVGIVSLLADRRNHLAGNAGDPSGLFQHTQQIEGGLPVLVGVSTPRQQQALASSWSRLTAAVANGSTNSTQETAPGPSIDAATAPPLRINSDCDGHLHPGSDADVLIDVGALIGDQPTEHLLDAIPLVLLVCKPTVGSVAHTKEALATLRRHGAEGGPRLGVIVIGSGTDCEAVRGLLADEPSSRTLFLGHLAEDPVAARALSGSWTRRLDRSPLVASGRRLARDLHAALREPLRLRDSSTSAALVGQDR